MNFHLQHSGVIFESGQIYKLKKITGNGKSLSNSCIDKCDNVFKKMWSHMKTGQHTVIIFLGGVYDEDPIATGD